MVFQRLWNKIRVINSIFTKSLGLDNMALYPENFTIAAFKISFLCRNYLLQVVFWRDQITNDRRKGLLQEIFSMSFF